MHLIQSINEVLSVIVNFSIILGIGVVFYFYYQIKKLDTIIEQKNIEFEEKREMIRKQPIAQVFIDGQIESHKRILEESISPLERKRSRILSKIPFIK